MHLLLNKTFCSPSVLRLIATLEHNSALGTCVLGISSQSHAFCGRLTQPLTTLNSKE
uniref:Macaca fascicularis brain cDNA clone: QflA-11885, similar to human low density lipoprotein-related protein 1B (deleted intumors) (LRP1B), mRNA, RefSeq: NM_018557.1 n=1 Tax=Macaca fascicularis TaxID=9541 RepID=I7G475_MACFA|nr:unnamed protein product [Macaca fascicularis]